MSIMLIALFALFTTVEASFSSSFAQGYIISDIMDIKIKSNKEISKCYTFPSKFTKDIIIPAESYLYDKNLGFPPLGERLNSPKSSFAIYKRNCEWHHTYFKIYSHSIVPGGFEVISYTTLLTPLTEFIIRLDILAKVLLDILYQSAVIPSTLVTARSASKFS